MISIIVPNFNHSSFLPLRLSSIINQSCNSYECILLDDFSNDSSLEILQNTSLSDIRFQLHVNDQNSGSTFSQWNKGVNLSKYEYVWIAESDDVADSALLNLLLNKIESNPDVVLVYSQSYKINERGDIDGTWLEFTNDLDSDNIFSKDFVMDGKEYIRKYLIHRNTIPNASAVLFRKSVFEKIGGAPIHLKNNGDWITWLKMLCFGEIAYLSTPLNYFRKHDNSVIAKLHHKKTSNLYLEQHDSLMRKEFSSFLMDHSISILPEVLHINRYYISLDIGNRGLYLLKNGYYFNGWKDIINATFTPKFKSGFLKKALRMS